VDVVDEELLQVGLLGPLVVEEQLSEHFIERQPEFVRLHHVLVILDWRLPHDFIVFFHDFLLFDFVVGFSEFLLFILNVCQIN